MAKAAMRIPIWIGMLCLVGMTFGAPARADGADEFHAGVADAYGHYREAFFYLRRENPMTAAFELEAFGDKWRAIEGRFAAAPPVPYAGDAAWAKTLSEVGATAKAALDQAAEGEAAAAYETLKPIRGRLADLRRRNNVVLFRDHVEGAGAAFQSLFHFRRNPPDFSDAATVATLRQRLDAAIKAYENCRDKAPPEIAAQAQFSRLITDSLYYLDRMWLAIEEKNQLNVVNILRRVVSSDQILWLRFG